MTLEECKVVIGSGLGSRSENIEYTNKFGKGRKKAVISHIIDSYPSGTSFVSLGHYGEHVRQYINIASIKVEFVNVKNYRGKGSSLEGVIQC